VENNGTENISQGGEHFGMVEYTNHTKQDISGYNDYLPERPEELLNISRLGSH